MLDSLSSLIKQTAFQDAKNSSKDPCLVGPPTLEFAPYSKMQSGRARHDGRQGTIDQDQEFIDFLQSLTEPITKAAANGVDADATSEKITTTPLVQYLKERKANKAKEAAEKKSKAKQETKEAKPSKGESKATVVVKGSSAAEKARVAKATQDAVKAINKSVASMQTKPAAKGDSKSPTKETATLASPPKRERERPNVSAAARIQRDLGLAPKSPRAARTTAASPATAKAEPANPEKSSTSTPETKTTSTPTPIAPPTGPRATRSTPVPPPSTPKPPTTQQRPPKPPPTPSPNAKSAFLKHANPSQGVTEELLRTAFAAFGVVTRCEIDKKKGLGYVDFEKTESLRKAMQGSPVKVGNGQVVVMENRNPGKGKGGVVKGESTLSVVPVPATQQSSPKTSESPVTNVSTPAVVAPPTAPRGNPRGNTRGGRGGTPTALRGNAGAAARGGARGGGFRGARAAAATAGAVAGRGSGGIATTANTTASAAENVATSVASRETGRTGDGGDVGK